MLREWADDPTFGGPSLLAAHTFGFDANDRVVFSNVIAQTNVTWNHPIKDRVVVYDELSLVVDELNDVAPETMSGLLQVGGGRLVGAGRYVCDPPNVSGFYTCAR